LINDALLVSGLYLLSLYMKLLILRSM